MSFIWSVFKTLYFRADILNKTHTINPVEYIGHVGDGFCCIIFLKFDYH
jgi:hypothetical protein